MQLVALIELLEQSRIMRRVGDFVIETVRQKIPVHAVKGHLELAPIRHRWLLAEIPPVHGHHGCGLQRHRIRNEAVRAEIERLEGHASELEHATEGADTTGGIKDNPKIRSRWGRERKSEDVL